MQSKAQTEHVAGGRENNSSFYHRPQGARLGFVHAKEDYFLNDFMADREKALGLSEKQGSGNSSQDAKAGQQPSNQDGHGQLSQLEIQDPAVGDPVTPALADFCAERDAEYDRISKQESEVNVGTDAAKEELKLPEDANSRNELKLTKQKSSGPFENVSAVELAKLFNVKIGQDGDCDIGHLEYDEAKRKSDEAEELPDFRARKERQSSLLKGLPQHTSDLPLFSRIRTSVFNKSMS